MNFIKNIFKKLFHHPSSHDRTSSYLHKEDHDFISDSKSALLNQSSPIASGILFFIIIVLIIGVIWAYFGTIDQVTVGDGKVIPSSYVKVIQSLDGGIVSEILVDEGELVKPKQVLMKLDDTRYKSDFQAGYAKYLVLSATVARLNAEAEHLDKINFPAEVLKHRELVDRETKFFETRKNALNQELTLLQQSYATAKKQLAMYEELLPKGYTSKVEYLRILQNSIDTNRHISEKTDDFYEQVNKDLTDYRGQLDTLVQQLQNLHDKLVRTTIMSPVNGVIKKININTIGGVITPGMEIMEIVPLNDTLLVEAYVNPADIAFVHVGQTASVKITAYDFSIYGKLTGKIEYISADTEKREQDNKNPLSMDDRTYYVVKVRTTKNYLGNEKEKLLIMPGMTATVYIKTGHKTILQYLLKPLIKAKEEALRER